MQHMLDKNRLTLENFIRSTELCPVVFNKKIGMSSPANIPSFGVSHIFRFWPNGFNVMYISSFLSKLLVLIGTMSNSGTKIN